MLARAQCQPFVLVGCSLIYFLWGWSLILCSSKNLICRSKRHSEVRFKGWDVFRVWFFSWISTPAPRNISSGELILRVSLFLIDLKQEVNCGGTNVLIIWGRTIATLRLSAGSADARMLFTSQFTAMWQRKFIEHLLHAEQMCGAGKGNKKFSFHYNISCISCSWMPLTCLAQFRCSINVE